MKQPFALILIVRITQSTQWWKTLYTSRSCVYRQLFRIILFYFKSYNGRQQNVLSTKKIFAFTFKAYKFYKQCLKTGLSKVGLTNIKQRFRLNKLFDKYDLSF